MLTADRMLHAATAIVALSACGSDRRGTLDPRGDWPTVWALAALAVAAPCALPWWPRRDARATWWRQALVGIAPITIPALWTRVDAAVLGTGLLAGATLYVARGRGRVALLVLAVGVLFGVHMLAHSCSSLRSSASSPAARAYSASERSHACGAFARTS